MTRKRETKTGTRLEFRIAILLVFNFFGTNSNICFVRSLAPPQQETGSNCRRRALSALGSACTAVFLGSRIVTTADVANAAIDVSGLRKEPVIPTSTDVFLGGTYFVDDEPASDETVERFGRMKYTIELTSLVALSETRKILVRGRSSTISSRSDYYVELPGKIFQCPEGDGGFGNGDGSVQRQRQCISIDFSPTGGQRDIRGYWDEKENGIRFILDNKVWSKQ
mmetsp:Transcript_14140/g.28191  ORF Transcript_14140/g.28191 Transcript_14140/m.28191 type:complete len:224 (+) Transcript_14140:86-757(+)|eukprot:CAMPEP_0194344296 /NCGR_PEP_ID=MMETSP0171-20130528/100855_1 /TAXON_ID=218684 /ORGANISM="Corethron pennatum, Strain L29A3" /LENGTH=223 /DNA_ID=CAMNT_0039110919 /DNA_START=22 /DNA_END=693 /DNA_ORIENTATION=+